MGSFLTSQIMLIADMGDILKFLSRSRHDLAWKKKVGLGGCGWFLTGDLEDWGHLFIIDHVGR